jgi:hypothetical protein
LDVSDTHWSRLPEKGSRAAWDLRKTAKAMQPAEDSRK